MIAEPAGRVVKRIFLIDDEAEMTQLAGSLLKFSGFQVETANDPVAGLARLLNEDFDAIVIDLMMLPLDGHSLLRQLRESPRHSETPIIVLSAKSLDGDERKSLLLSKVRYLPKPVSPSRLVQIVRDSVKKA